MTSKYDKDMLIDTLCNQTSIPNLLLDYYSFFGITDAELVFLINLLRIKPCVDKLSISTIEEFTNYDACDVNDIISNLVSKQIVNYSTYDKSFKLDGLYNKIYEAWGLEMRKKEMKQQLMKDKVNSDDYKKIYNIFEQEFARPLSPKEGEMLKDWLGELTVSVELIDEALKRSTMMDKRNFAYINQILLDWKSKNYKTLDQVRNELNNKSSKNKDQKFKSKHFESSRKISSNVEDIYEV